MTDKRWEETLIWDGENLKPGKSTDQLARKWAEKIKADSTITRYEDVYAAADFILDNTPKPTMADVEWEDEKHYLAGATSEIDGSECVMIAPLDGLIVNVPLWGGRLALTSPGALTPNGKRYEPREVTVSSNENVGPDQQDHPAVLSTVEDYENAPDGTIVFHSCGYPWTKEDGLWRSLIFRESSAALGTALIHARTVARWGEGDAA